MEAKLIRYGAEQITNAAGQIAVTATKEEWGAVIDEILRGGKVDSAEDLVRRALARLSQR